jgi:hypothetical protein
MATKATMASRCEPPPASVASLATAMACDLHQVLVAVKIGALLWVQRIDLLVPKPLFVQLLAPLHALFGEVIFSDVRVVPIVNLLGQNTVTHKADVHEVDHRFNGILTLVVAVFEKCAQRRNL